MKKTNLKTNTLNFRFSDETLSKLDDLCVAYNGMNRTNVITKIIEVDWLRVTKKGIKETADIQKQMNDMLERIKQYAEQ